MYLNIIISLFDNTNMETYEMNNTNTNADTNVDTNVDAINYQYHNIRQLTEDLIDKPIWVQGRVHTIRGLKRQCFIVLRYKDSLLQTIGFKKGVTNFSELCNLKKESIINLCGYMRKSPFEIKFATYKTIEFEIREWNISSEINEELPFSLDDANDCGESFRCDVGQSLKLNNRWIDLRTPINQSIFKIKSTMCQLFREFLLNNDFTEVQTPKTIGVASESGAEVFELNYFNKKAYLAQSPQLYKQMLINSDFDRVFEIGPVFRAENSNSRRHLCEFTGLDLEMAISPNMNYHEVLHFIWELLGHIFDGIKSKCTKELEIINNKLPFTDLIYPTDPLIISFKDGVDMLNDAGCNQEYNEDLSTVNERKLGELVKEKYGSDLFVLDEYPINARPFYTMPHKSKPGFTHSYDIILRGREISSGAQRLNDYNKLIERMNELNLDPESIKSYLDSFKYGSKSHGGCGFGLERLLTYYLDLDNIRQSSLFPRDPERLNP